MYSFVTVATSQSHMSLTFPKSFSYSTGVTTCFAGVTRYANFSTIYAFNHTYITLSIVTLLFP